jgi:hypothetical protein
MAKAIDDMGELFCWETVDRCISSGIVADDGKIFGVS